MEATSFNRNEWFNDLFDIIHADGCLQSKENQQPAEFFCMSRLGKVAHRTIEKGCQKNEGLED